MASRPLSACLLLAALLAGCAASPVSEDSPPAGGEPGPALPAPQEASPPEGGSSGTRRIDLGSVDLVVAAPGWDHNTGFGIPAGTVRLEVRLAIQPGAYRDLVVALPGCGPALASSYGQAAAGEVVLEGGCATPRVGFQQVSTRVAAGAFRATLSLVAEVPA